MKKQKKPKISTTLRQTESFLNMVDEAGLADRTADSKIKKMHRQADRLRRLTEKTSFLNEAQHAAL